MLVIYGSNRPLSEGVIYHIIYSVKLLLCCLFFQSCFGTGIVRRRRSENQTSSVPETLVTRVKVLQPDGKIDRREFKRHSIETHSLLKNPKFKLKR